MLVSSRHRFLTPDDLEQAKRVCSLLPTMMGGFGGGAYQISRSVRLRASASANLVRTFGAPTNQNVWTWSGWVKRGQLAAVTTLFGASSGASPAYDGFRFNSDDTLQFFMAAAASVSVATTALFRDPAAHYHVHLMVDLTQATAANRVVLQVNGVTQTLSGTFPAQNPTATTYNFNRSGAVHTVGSGVINGAYSFYLDGVVSDVHFIDGQALDASSFGQTDAATGAWVPKKYVGTFGANGFHLDFSDNSAATAAALGADRSGNGNNWTPTNISVAAGATNDSSMDVPIGWGVDTGAGGEVRGNYCTLNPLGTSPATTKTFSDANMKVTGGAASFNSTEVCTWNLTQGKWYFEGTVGAIGTNTVTGIGTTAVYYDGSGSFSTTGSGAAYTTGDIIGVAVDVDGGTVQFFKNGVSQGTLTTGAGAEARPSVTLGGAATAPIWILNFGQRPFAYAAPAGFKALCTQNLPDPTIKKPSQYFDVNTRSGTGAAATISGKGFQPDLLWIKARGGTGGSHHLADSARGVANILFTDSSSAEASRPLSVTGFTTDGYTLGTGSDGNVNTSGQTYVDWFWKRGAVPGFDIVGYIGNGANRTIAHSLGVAPAMIIVKDRSVTNDWAVGHRSLTSWAYNLLLDSTLVQTSNPTVWNSTAPTSSVFSVGTHTVVNQNGDTYLAYLFAEVAGFSKFGSYAANGNADGPFVWCGFRPRYVMIKRIDVANDWYILDTARDTVNPLADFLEADASAAEGVSASSADFLSNGFKIRNTAAAYNASGGTYVFAAFAHYPFKYARAR